MCCNLNMAMGVTSYSRRWSLARELQRENIFHRNFPGQTEIVLPMALTLPVQKTPAQQLLESPTLCRRLVILVDEEPGIPDYRVRFSTRGIWQIQAPIRGQLGFLQGRGTTPPAGF